MDSNPGVLQFLAYKATNMLAKRREAKQGKSRARTWFQAIVRFLFSIAGFGCLTLAGFTINITTGFVVAGVSFFGLSFLTTGDTDSANTKPQPPEPRLR